MTNVLSRSAPPESSIDYDPIVEAYQTKTQDITLVTVGNILLRHRWLLICFAIIGYIMFAVGSYMPYYTYTATTAFVPRNRSQQSVTSSVLSQLGIPGGGGGGGAYYMEVIRSPRVLGPVVQSAYSFKTDTGVVQGSLIDIYGLRGAQPRYALAGAISQVQSQMNTTSPIGGGMMKLSVTTKYAALSAQLAQRILIELNRFNLETRQEQASAERQFVEGRVADARIQLTTAENDQQQFINENQYFHPISPLALEFDRLKREVELRQELYTSLAKLLDQARIEEVRDSPALTVIEPADIPLGPDPSAWSRKALFGAFIGIFLGILIAFLHSYIARTKGSYSDEYAEMARLKEEMSLDFRRPWRPLFRILATGRP